MKKNSPKALLKIEIFSAESDSLSAGPEMDIAVGATVNLAVGATVNLAVVFTVRVAFTNCAHKSASPKLLKRHQTNWP